MADAFLAEMQGVASEMLDLFAQGFSHLKRSDGQAAIGQAAPSFTERGRPRTPRLGHVEGRRQDVLALVLQGEAYSLEKLRHKRRRQRKVKKGGIALPPVRAAFTAPSTQAG